MMCSMNSSLDKERMMKSNFDCVSGFFLCRTYIRRRWHFYKKINTLIHNDFLFNNLT